MLLVEDCEAEKLLALLFELELKAGGKMRVIFETDDADEDDFIILISGLQVLEQPSLETAFPSSHSSPRAFVRMPSPQT